MNKNHFRRFSFRNLVILTITLVVLSIFSVSVSPVLASKIEDSRLKSISVALNEIKNLLNVSFFYSVGQNLTKEEIILWTNNARYEEGLSPLKEDLDLDTVAGIRLADMESKQYFDHYSPEGRGISEEAIDYGYKFISVGENLAQGNFKDSKALVEAWMNSPGHRENILKDQYTKIGVAAKEVIFDGQKSWLIVQAFSRPLSECVEPSQDLKQRIRLEREDLKKLTDEANEMLLRMNNYRVSGNIDSYNQSVPIYNDLVKEVNEKTGQLETDISSYNTGVAKFNYCLES